MKNKILKFIGGILFVGGFIGIIGSVGALENDSITVLQTIIQALISLVVCLAGYVITCLGVNEEANYGY